MRKAFSASKIFTGQEWVSDHAVVIEDGSIKELMPSSEAGSASENFGDCLIVPAFIDAQVYGAAGKLFALYPEAQTLQLMRETFLNEGTILFVPTIATNPVSVLKKSIDALREYWRQDGKGVPGLHLEGPWLNPVKRGAHIQEWIHPPTVAEVKDLLDYGEGAISMITVAPEVCPDEIIRLILSYRITISAGHSNIGYQDALRSFAAGIRTVTHLYNAMSPLHHRGPGLVGAAFNHPDVMSSIIPDGHHVDDAAVRIAKKLMGNRLFAITDAVTETDSGPYRHHFTGDQYECDGILSGSALSMHKAFLNLVDRIGIDVEEALRMCSLYPARALGCDDRYGKIAPGYSGQLLVLDKSLEVLKVLSS
jgi:N-acetylglucosamine-6-phosphate deacetylase